MRNGVVFAGVGLAGTLALAACGDSAGPSGHVAAHVTALAIPSCTAGQPLPQPLTVEVTDALNRPVAGVVVTFAVVAGSGSLAAASAVSDASGRAEVGFTCGGDNATVSASAVGVSQPATFTITTGPGPVAKVVFLNTLSPNVVAADTQVGQVGGGPAPLDAQPQDAFGHPIYGLSTDWVVGPGSGSLQFFRLPVDPNINGGIATNPWTAGSTPGLQSVVVSVTGMASISRTLYVRTYADVGLMSGAALDPPFTVGPGQTVAQPLRVHLTAPDGTPLSHVAALFTVPCGTYCGHFTPAPGTVTLSPGPNVGYVLTDGQGEAAAIFTAGTQAASNSALASVAVIAATGGYYKLVDLIGAVTPGPAVQISPTGGDNQSGHVGTTLPVPLIAQVKDSYLNPVPGVSVTWAVSSGGGSLSAVTTTSDAQGTVSAIWTLGPTVGAQTVSVAIAAGPSTSFTAGASP